MPETSVNEDDLVPPRKNQIRLTRKVGAMKPETITHAMRHAAHKYFRGRVATSYGAHDPASLLALVRYQRNSILKLGSVSNSSTISL